MIYGSDRSQLSNELEVSHLFQWFEFSKSKMPVTDKPEHARDKAVSRTNENSRMEKICTILMYTMLAMSSTDYVVLRLLTGTLSCPCEHPNTATYEMDGYGLEDLLENELMTDNYTDLVTLPALPANFELDYFDPNTDLAFENLIENYSDFISEDIIDEFDWDDREDDADPTKNRPSSLYEDLCELVKDMLHDFALYKDQDALDIAFSEDVAFDVKAMFDSLLFDKSF